MKKKQKRNRACKAKAEFTAKTRLFDLVRKEHHADLRQLVDDMRPWLTDGDSVGWKSLKRLNVDYSKTTNAWFFLIITEFLCRIRFGKGLTCTEAVFIRYLASTEHSNFSLKESSVKTLVYKQLSFLKWRKNDQKFGSTKNENDSKSS